MCVPGPGQVRRRINASTAGSVAPPLQLAEIVPVPGVRAEADPPVRESGVDS